MNRLVLCADDFAFSPDVSRTIAELLHAGRLNATGCMTVRPNWDEDAALLAGLPPLTEIGLHLVLTEERPLLPNSFSPDGRLPGINALHRLARRGQLPPGEIMAEIDRQFDRFQAVMGRAPDFVDGHQHAHALPGIRDLVLEITRRRAPGAWLRTCEDRWPALMARPFRGKAVASALHSRGLRAQAKRHGLRCNRGFAGHYGFTGDYAAMFPQFLTQPGPRHLVMCHPGHGRREGDAIADARLEEARALRRLPVRELAEAHGLSFAA